MLRPKKSNIPHSIIRLSSKMIIKANQHLLQITSIIKKKVELYNLAVKLLELDSLLIN